MTQICPNCSYIRKASDNGPAWQCPACQVVYTKAGDTGSPTLFKPVTSANSGASADRDNSALWKWLLIAFLISAALWQLKPIHRFAGKHNAHAQQVGDSNQAMQQPVVILYGTTWCGYCAAAREFFKANDIAYTDLDTEKTTEGYEGHKKLGGGGVPLIVIDGEVMHGYSEAGLRQALAPWIKS
ncbi:NrdH-redoxin [Undibacterium sp. Jales W-56]|uniref:glutaredoxin domain-containing protein n=1 Tax=Undibacterium sp. Jales W-56 TaxID=2897325 RepID=UPI0021D37BC3|nr:glutaredoxin domain-containing protein [Undibacterium sp. Jales W-56]MCU6433114.1 NrdH-redoxin [Undibacterium sp. Jales W-56]